MIKKKIDSYTKGDFVNGVLFIRHTSKGSGRKAIFKCELCSNEWETEFNKIRNRGVVKCGNCSRIEGGVRLNKINSSKPKTTKFGENLAYRRIKIQAISRGLEFMLSKKEVISLIVDNCNYCGIAPYQIKKTSGLDFIHHGIDRVNNSVCYQVGNVVACCVVCNKMKSNMSVDDFINHIKLIVTNN